MKESNEDLQGPLSTNRIKENIQLISGHCPEGMEKDKMNINILMFVYAIPAILTDFQEMAMHIHRLNPTPKSLPDGVNPLKHLDPIGVDAGGVDASGFDSAGRAQPIKPSYYRGLQAGNRHGSWRGPEIFCLLSYFITYGFDSGRKRFIAQ